MRIAAAILALALSGCTLGPDFKVPFLNFPKSYPQPEVSAKTAPLPVPSNWWLLYEDPALDQLVATALKNNADVRIAIARMEEAEAFLREVNSASLLPSIDGDADASRSRVSTRSGTFLSNARPIRNNFELSASTSFEIDFWGRLRRTREAAREQYAASRYGHDVVALALVANVVQTYFTVRGLDAQIVVSEESLRAADDTLDIARKRSNAGFVSDLDVYQSESVRVQIAAQLKELRRLRNAAVHQLGVLSGLLDLQLPAGDVRTLPAAPLPPAGLPSTLLERRPDIKQSEATLAAANAQIGVAQAARLPTISLTGAWGTQSNELSTLFHSGSGLWSIGLNAAGPILDWGRYKARTQQAEARARQAAATYEKTAQTAFREVSDALSNVRLAAETEQDLAERVKVTSNTLRLATLRYDAGYSAYLEVLDAQRTFNDAQLALVRNRQQYLGYTVDLMNALGGGWVPY